MAQPILIEGYTPDEILALPQQQLEALVLDGRPLILRIGSAEVLGEFRISGKHLIVEMAQIEGGGEGVLPTLWLVVERWARQRGLAQIEWIVHALTCARPNPKLRRVLQRRGFEVRDLPEIGAAYYFKHIL